MIGTRIETLAMTPSRRIRLACDILPSRLMKNKTNKSCLLLDLVIYTSPTMLNRYWHRRRFQPYRRQRAAWMIPYAAVLLEAAAGIMLVLLPKIYEDMKLKLAHGPSRAIGTRQTIQEMGTLGMW